MNRILIESFHVKLHVLTRSAIGEGIVDLNCCHHNAIHNVEDVILTS
jgi:hypothetical protein